mgnify:CR=1 FL=1
MNTKEAVAKRIQELCAEYDMAVNALATASGIPPSTVYSMLNEKSQNPGVVSIKKICDGLGISIREFFDTDLFDNLGTGDKIKKELKSSFYFIYFISFSFSRRFFLFLRFRYAPACP